MRLMLRLSLSFILILTSLITLSAQFSLTGIVSNAYGEDLEGAVIYIEGSQDLATVSDQAGRYLLENIPAGPIKLVATFLGYDKFEKKMFLEQDELEDIIMSNASFQIDRVEVTANKLDDADPFSFIEQNKEDIEFKNLGQDLPFLVEHTPSTVVTSDAGSGIGYTGLRIRGSDATRINVTINGVPLNDSESHGVFWVNLPDFSSSVDKLQIQRGVGPSTNGAAAFGGSLGLNTNYINQNPYLEANLSYGSFNSRRLGLNLSTGLMNGQYIIEGRYSAIKSDGYIDRASSDLSSWFFSVGKIGKNHTLKLNIFSGKERTYQAWYGVPEVKLNGSQQELLTHYQRNSFGGYNTVADSLNLFDSERSYNYYTYENEVDDYKQDHYQLLYAVQPTDNLKVNLTGHYTRGKGFFEQFRYQDDLCNYIDCNALKDTSIINTITDLARRKWLDNHFVGAIANAEVQVNDAVVLMGGGSYNTYLGDHFGVVSGAQDTTLRKEIAFADNTEYYRSEATKNEFNTYLKADIKLADKIKLFADVQLRNITYTSSGIDDDGSLIAIDTSYTFVNPKLGISYQLDERTQFYLSYAKASREPIRSDFLDAVGVAIPNHESLHDLELGYRKVLDKLDVSANLYYMLYQDQLVLTGAINDVGGPVRTNVDRSSRLGLELSAAYKINDYLTWEPNLTLSRNKIKEFTELILDFDTTMMNQTTVFENSDIAFSPSIIAGSKLTYNVIPGLDIGLLSKFVGKQFLDNTSNDERSLNSYLVNDFIATYNIESELLEKVEFKLLVNNFLNAKFSSNGYTYSYLNKSLVTENYLYPQAGINFLLGLSLKF